MLVATTIVESGLDIPRANTMFVARADAFGLAQLYQLRGRIGRSARARVLLPARARARAHHRRRAPPPRGAAAVHRARRGLPDRLAGSRDPRRRRAARREAVGLDRGGRLRSLRQDARGRGRRAARQADPQRDRSRAHDRDRPASSPTTTSPIRASGSSSTSGCRRSRTTTSCATVMAEIGDRYGPLPGDVVLLGELMGVKALARGLGALALEISQARASRSRCPTIRPMARRPRSPPAGASCRWPVRDGARSRRRPAAARQALVGGRSLVLPTQDITHAETMAVDSGARAALDRELPEAGRSRHAGRARRAPPKTAPSAPPQSAEEMKAPLAKIDDVTITLGEFQERINRQSPYIRARYTSLEQKKEFLDSLVRFEVLAKEADAARPRQGSRGRPHDEAGDDPEADARRVRREGQRRHGQRRRDEEVLRREPRRVRQARGGPRLGDHPQEQGAGRSRAARGARARPARPTRASAISSPSTPATRRPSCAAATCATSTSTTQGPARAGRRGRVRARQHRRRLGRGRRRQRQRSTSSSRPAAARR